MTVTTGRAYAGKTADERYSDRRQRLLDAGLEIIGRQGYPAMTIPRLCATAKVSTRHFYEMYSTKEDVFVDLYDELTADAYGRVMASLESTKGQTLRERLPAAVIAYVHPMISDIRIARISFVEIMGASPRIEKLRLDYRETLIALVTAEGEAAVKRGEVASRDWRFASLALVGGVTATAYDWVVQRKRPSRGTFESLLAELALSVLTMPSDGLAASAKTS